MDKKTIISAHNISIGYKKNKQREQNILYHDISFDLYAGELVCLLGANGAGKSTLLRTISANQSAISGKIYFHGKDITQYTEKNLSKLLGIILTDKTNVGGLTVRELVDLGRYPYTGFFGQLSSEDKAIVEQSMANVNILHKADSYVAELSDGERQKAMIAKALSQECPILLLDEPTAFLDIEGRIEIMNLLHRLAITHGKTILLTTHDIDLALRLADRLWLLSPTTSLISGTTEDVILSGEMDTFFGSKNIEFRKETGNFVPIQHSTRLIYVEGSSILRYWGQNILTRYGFNIASNKSEAEFTLIAESANNLLFVDSHEKQIHFNSFSQLANYLSKIRV